MNHTIRTALLVFIIAFTATPGDSQVSELPIAIAIHGGAGTITRDRMNPEMEKAYEASLTEALQAGFRILRNGGTSLDAVEAAILIMEDSPLFNAGKGAVLTSAGEVELDASIMDGKTLRAGAVTVLKHVKNPIKLARLVMEKTEHVLLAGTGAEEFGKKHSVEFVDQDYFFTERRKRELNRERSKEEKTGTVGCVALDMHGNLAAGTSTGGRTNKLPGRIGDTPIIGAGNYANNLTCAVSGTGHGEYFIRGVVAYEIAALMAYKGASVKDAAKTVIDKLSAMGGEGGVIALDKGGNITMPFNTEGMYRGFIDKSGNLQVKIYKE